MTMKMTIRFNTDKEPALRAWKYLQTADVSYSKAVIQAINAYLDLQSEEERKDAFFQQVRNIIREEVRSNPMVGLMPYFQQPAESKPMQADEDTMLAFLDAFDGA